MATPTPRPQKQPQLLPLHLLILCCVALPVFLACLTIGLVGMAVILDEDKSSPLSQSTFGVIYWGLIQRNPYISAMAVNGGGLGVLVCGKCLADHFQAKKQQKAAVAAASEKEATKPETKKSK